MYQIEFTRKAEIDLDEAADWYEKQSFQLGLAFLERFQDAYVFMENRPESARFLAEGVRYHKLKKFPFNIFFECDEPTKTVVIFAILHEKRHPDNWKMRFSQI